MNTAPPKLASELLGAPDPPRTGRERLVAAAVDLFYRNGFGAVGVDRVIAAAGVTKTTFYKHFEGKDDLMVAAGRRGGGGGLGGGGGGGGGFAGGGRGGRREGGLGRGEE